MSVETYTFTHEPNQCSNRNRDQAAAVRIDAEIKRVLNRFSLRPDRAAAFERLVSCVRTRTHLLRPTRGQARPGWAGPMFLLKRLQNLAERRSHWLRPCEEWQPSGENLRPAFRSFAGHLLADYPVPGFMDSVWDLPPGPESFRRQAWYIRLGRGASFRELNFPLVLTRRMEHYIRHAPDHYTVEQALRYGEVLGLGGSEKLAGQIALGALGRKIQRPEFWRTVIQFFVNHPEIELELINPMVDFIQANKFAGEAVLTNQGTACRPAPWPDFSIKGRTPGSMLRLLRDWNQALDARKPSQSFSWSPSAIQGFRFLENADAGDEQREWSIHELLSSSELYAEGRALRHCVYTYALKCRDGNSAVWSLRLRVNGVEKRMATIEVDPRGRAIVQTRAKCNRYAGVHSQKMIRHWAAVAGLRVEPLSW